MKYAPEVVGELADLAAPEKLMDELERALGVHPHRPPGGRGTKLAGGEGIRRYRPHHDNDLRVFYAIQDPRKQAYRRQNIETALARFQRALH